MKTKAAIFSLFRVLSVGSVHAGALEERRRRREAEEEQWKKQCEQWRKEAEACHSREEKERRRKEAEARRIREEGERIFVRVFAMAAKMAKADGVADAVEVKVAEQLLSRFKIQESRDLFKAAFNNALLHPEGIYEDADALAAMVDALETRAFIYDLLWDVACADGVLTPEEKEILVRVCSHLRLPESYFDLNYIRRMSYFKEGTRRSRRAPEHVSPLDAAYAALGCHPDATDEEVRRAYRTAAKTYHPDILRASNVSDEMIAVANRKMAALNAAWDCIRRARRM